MSSRPIITRVRHEPKRRRATVVRLQRLGATMMRIVFGGEELDQFTSLGFDDHVKLFFPSDEPSSGPLPAAAQAGWDESLPVLARRDYTPRRFDAAARELSIDFYLHSGGVAAMWAAQAVVGQPLTIGGPRGSFIISPEGIDSHVLIGDETALPAIGRRLEELPESARALVVIESDGGAAGYPLQSKAALGVVDVTRRAPTDSPGKELLGALRQLAFPPGQCFAWVAAESQTARAIRRYLTEERGLDRHWVRAAGYWQRGATGTHDALQDGE